MQHESVQGLNRAVPSCVSIRDRSLVDLTHHSNLVGHVIERHFATAIHERLGLRAWMARRGVLGSAHRHIELSSK